MRIVSTNIGEPRTINWKGKAVTTGIFKYGVNEPLFLGKEDVVNDHVINRKYHGGIDKACYLYSADHYAFWQKRYPKTEMPWGTFGENLTVEGLNEATINIGNIYKVGDAVVQVTQPRQPCFKMEFRIPDPQIITRFIEAGFPGIYLRILEEGKVKTSDTFQLIEEKESLSIQKVFELLYTSELTPLIEQAINDPFLADACRKDLQKRLKK